MLKKTLMTLIVLSSFSALADDIVCQISLIDSNTEEVLAEREIRQSSSGMVSGSVAGSDFYIESMKRRLLRKPIPSSVISFGRVQNGWDNSTEIQFWRKSIPNRYGILTQTDNIGSMLRVLPGETVQENLGDDYLANVECSLQESQYLFY
jgi:hypothetical protein